MRVLSGLAVARLLLTMALLTVVSGCFELAPRPDAEPTSGGHDAKVLAVPSLTLPQRAGWMHQLWQGQPLRHASCEQALPSRLPLSPGEIVPPSEGNQSGACEPDLPHAAPCDEHTPCLELTDVCVHPGLGSKGLCVQDGWAPEYATTLSYAHGACAKVINVDQKQLLCCDEVPGVDCRARTLGDGQSAPGEMCRLHTDCEQGLVCASPEDVRWLRGWGRCTCPGVPVERIANHPDCESPADRLHWGATPVAQAARCVAGASAGWVVERLATGLTRQALGVVADGAGTLHIAFEAGGLTYLRVAAQGSTSEAVAELPEASFTVAPEHIGIALDQAGEVHVLDALHDVEGPLYAHRKAGAWATQRLGAPVRDFSLYMAADHTLHLGIAYTDQAAIYDLTLPDGASPGALVLDGVIPYELVHVRSADQESFVYLDVNDLQRVRVGSGEVTPLDTLAGSISAAAAASGDLIVAYQAGYDDVLRLLRVRGDEPADIEDLWTPDTRHYVVDNCFPSVALDSADRVHVAHRAPEGILLREQHEGAWQVTSVAKDAARPQLLIDARDEPNLFYVVAGELRHAHRGTCPGMRP